MEKKVAFITGAGSGIGRGIAIRLAKDGFNIAINDLNEAGLKETAAEIEKVGAVCKYYVSDLTSENDMDRTFAGIEQDYGRLDVLVNNAGICPMRTFEQITADSLRRTFDINVVTMLICSERAVALMKKQGGGKIINAASQSAFRVTATGIEYGATKYAVRGLTLGMATALAKYNICVNCYCPGFVPTPMQDAIAQNAAKALGSTPENVRANMLKQIPLGRAMSAENDIGALVSFLAGPGGDNITGQSIMVNGGTVMN